MNVMDYLKPELLILIPALWGLGMVMKATPLDNRWIPLLLAACSIILSGLWVVGQGMDNVFLAVFSAITQGVIAWLAAWISYDKGIKNLQKIQIADAQDRRGTDEILSH